MRVRAVGWTLGCCSPAAAVIHSCLYSEIDNRRAPVNGPATNKLCTTAGQKAQPVRMSSSERAQVILKEYPGCYTHIHICIVVINL